MIFSITEMHVTGLYMSASFFGTSVLLANPWALRIFLLFRHPTKISVESTQKGIEHTFKRFRIKILEPAALLVFTILTCFHSKMDSLWPGSVMLLYTVNMHSAARNQNSSLVPKRQGRVTHFQGVITERFDCMPHVSTSRVSRGIIRVQFVQVLNFWFSSFSYLRYFWLSSVLQVYPIYFCNYLIKADENPLVCIWTVFNGRQA